jgi:hypothetical protein
MSKINFEEFINSSYIGENVKLPVNLIIHRTSLSPDELETIKNEEKYIYHNEKDKLYEIEAGGEVLAKGKIVKSNGEYYFKVVKTIGENK